MAKENMNTKSGIRRFIACFMICFFSIISAQASSDFITLDERETTLIEKGEVIVREVATNGKNGRTFEAIGTMNAPMETIVQVLTEYEKYPEFMPNISHVQILENRGNEVVLNYTLSLPLGKIKKYRLKISVTYLHDQHAVMQWQLMDWPELKENETIKDTTGFWRIEEKTPDQSLVQYHVYTDPGPIPFGLGWIVDVLSKNSIPEAFLKTKSRTEEIAGPGE